MLRNPVAIQKSIFSLGTCFWGCSTYHPLTRSLVTALSSKTVRVRVTWNYIQEAVQTTTVVPRSAPFRLVMLIDCIFVTKHCTSRVSYSNTVHFLGSWGRTSLFETGRFTCYRSCVFVAMHRKSRVFYI